MQFIHCFVGYPGSDHDQRVFNLSGLQNFCSDASKFPNDARLTMQPIKFKKLTSSLQRQWWIKKKAEKLQLLLVIDTNDNRTFYRSLKVVMG